MNARKISVGDPAILHNGKDFNALVTAVWLPDSINAAIVCDDPTRTDLYGREIVRYTSIPHQSRQPAHGVYWRFPDEAEGEL